MHQRYNTLRDNSTRHVQQYTVTYSLIADSRLSMITPIIDRSIDRCIYMQALPDNPKHQSADIEEMAWCGGAFEPGCVNLTVTDCAYRVIPTLHALKRGEAYTDQDRYTLINPIIWPLACCAQSPRLFLRVVR